MFKVGDCAVCNLRSITFIVEDIQDLGEGKRLGRQDEFGDTRWIPEDICKLIKEGPYVN